MSSIKSSPGYIECCHPLSHRSIKEHTDKHNGDGDYMLNLYLQSQIEIITQERLLDDYNKTEIQSIIPLDLNNDNLIMSSSSTIDSKTYSFDDYTKDKSNLITKGLGVKGKLIPYVFNHPTLPSVVQEKMKKRNRYSTAISSMFSLMEEKEKEKGLLAFRYPKTVDVHTLRSITIRLLIGLSPPYLKKNL